MKKIIVLSLVGLFFSLVGRPAFAQTSICNTKCDINEDCGQGYRCYVGVCRASACPSSATCGCAPATPTPTPSVKKSSPVPTATSTPTPTPVPKATPIATASGTVTRTPTTGVPGELLLAGAVSFASVGIAIKQRALNR